jgi:hypothetical protein
MKRALVSLMLAVPLAVAAQEAAPQLQEDPRAARFRDVERGLFVGFEIGYHSVLKTPVADPAHFPYAPSGGGGRAGGLLVGLSVGYDLSSRLALSLFALASELKADPSYGAFNVVGGGADVRFAVFASADSNDVERLYGYVHARGGYARTYPNGLFGTNTGLAQGGIGIEYYTRLRHFSVGVALDGLYYLEPKAAGFAVTPTLRYTF